MTASVAGDLVGKTLLPGVYKSSGPLAVSGTLTLDGQGNPNSVFIFQVASDLITASASNIVLTNSAQACNIYWQVGTSATLGDHSKFKGSILALTSITATTGTTVDGRALARTGQVALQSNVFTMSGCATAAAPAATASPAPTSSAPKKGRGVNIDTAAENPVPAAGTALGAAAAGLIGLWMLAGGGRLFRRNK